MPTLLTDLLLFFCLGCMGHWTGDRDCEPTQLTVVTRMGAFLSLAFRAQKPRPGRSEAGFCCWIIRTNYRRLRSSSSR